MAKKDNVKGAYVVFINAEGQILGDNEFHIVGKENEALCGVEIVPEADKFSKTKPKTCKGEKLTFCCCCEEAAKKKIKKALVKKKK